VTSDDTRNALRQNLRARRQELSAPEQTHAAHRLIAHLVATRLYRVSRRIAVYLPNDGEIDPVPLMARIWKTNKTCYLPILSRLRHDRLWFAPFTQDTPLAANRFQNNSYFGAASFMRTMPMSLPLPKVSSMVRINDHTW